MPRAPAPDHRGAEDAEVEAGPEVSDAEEFVFKGATHPDMVLSGLDILRRENTFTDVRIKVEEAEFPVHKCVLSAFSPYFKVRTKNTGSPNINAPLSLYKSGLEAATQPRRGSSKILSFTFFIFI